ncbi:retrovirus-related pol polyprotein from transposon TNT 1-94 [Tanacetum coccineum]
MHSKFDMSMMGELKFFLGIQINQSPRGIFINQAKHTQEILKKHGMTSCDSIGTPMATKHLDADLSGCIDSRKSTSGGIQFLGGDKLVSWSSKKQDCTSMSSTKAEYVSLFASCTQVLWLRTQLTDSGFLFDKIPMYYDSKAAIAISCNPVQLSCTKHIDVRYHFIKEQLADCFTKALSEDRFKYLVRRDSHGESNTTSALDDSFSFELEKTFVIGDSLNLPDHRFRWTVVASPLSSDSRIHKPHCAHTHAFKIRMEQYLQCIDYNLWEIVENGNAPIVTKTIDGKETAIPPTSVEEKAQRRA